LNTRNAYYLVAAATFAALTASAPRADVTQSVIATANATVKPAGPRTGTSGLKYFNVEGSANTTNASYGVLRFDSSSLKSAFDTQYGAGAYSITDLTLSLVEANSAFTHDGAIAFAFTPDNTTDISAANTSLKYDATTTPSSNYFAQSFIANGTFSTDGNVNSGTIDNYELLTGTAGSAALKNAILAGNVITLLVNDVDPTVAATWAGSTYTGEQPKLVVTAASTNAVPEPGSLALLFGAAPLALAIRRRRA